MKKLLLNTIKYFYLSSLCFFACWLNAQSNTAFNPSVTRTKTGWTAKPFENKVFIENKGQFENGALPPQIQYGINSNGQNIYFTFSGLTYRFDIKELQVKEQVNERKNESEEERERTGMAGKVNTKLVSMQWLHSDPNVKIITDVKVQEYYT